MKSPNNSGPGLAIAAAVIGGGMAALYLASHAQAWPHGMIASLMASTGHPTTHLMRAGIGGAVAAVLALVPGLWLEGKLQASQRRAAIRRGAKEAEQADAERERMKAKEASPVDSQAFAKVLHATTATEPSNQATPGFVATMLAGAGVVLTAAYFFLTHF